ncbi:hypothetical protein DYU11_05555 [Fibrisoma montanum]|uniref:Globin domain-containing protein n=1 Tax=Fibrisoma montanum TaxID=2305895 RepID=A0A418MK32_9BACT|nr:globin domain-containing protein [Fibrisoma montanum]RIV27764.1 hypothetical protein DYU11_05555 [Fibrisoma montanum]
MDARQILIIKHSWSYILLQSGQMEQMSALFYKTLFLDFPALKTLFHNDLAAQTRKFTDMMTFLVAHLQFPDELEGEMRALAQRHVAYGVHAVDYDLVGSVLLKTLARLLSERWTLELQTAWQTLYQTLSNAMQYNARQIL